MELWARQWGRHGWIEFNAPMGCWTIHLTKRPDDPTLKAWKEGTLQQAHEPTEAVALNRWNPQTRSYYFVPLDEYGTSGILELLDRGNTWSRRGEHDSIVDGVKKTREHNQKVREGMRENAREAGRDWASGTRRKAFDLPLVANVGIPEPSLNTPTKE